MKEAAKLTLVWGFGYVGMWVMKWVMASLILGENVMPYVTEHIGERLYGDIGVRQLTYICGAVTRNIGCLFPLEYGEIGVLFCFFWFFLFPITDMFTTENISVGGIF